MTVSRLVRRARTFATIGADRQGLVIEAVVRLAAARLVLIAIPFPRLAARWGMLLPPGDPRAASAPADDHARRIARRVQWAIETVAPLMPFRAACVQQAVAARGMLARRGIAGIVHFGIGIETGSVMSRDGIGQRVASNGRMTGRRSTSADDAVWARAQLSAGHAWVDAGGVKVTGFPLDPALVELGCFVRCP